MAKTASTMVPLGTPAPDFALPDCRAERAGAIVHRDDFASAPALLVMFICNHCPYVIHVRRALALLTRQWMKRGVAVVAICSNDSERYPADGPEAMAREAAEQDYPFPYLHDASQAVALAYRAACTPDFFLYDGERRLAYRGELDESRPSNGIEPSGVELGRAIDFVLEGRVPPEEQRASMGCGIKWRPENEDDHGPRYTATPGL